MPSPVRADTRIAPYFSLSAPGGGEGWGEVGDSRAVADTHLTLPALRAGPLPLPSEGRRGNCRRQALSGCDNLSYPAAQIAASRLWIPWGRAGPAAAAPTFGSPPMNVETILRNKGSWVATIRPDATIA